MRYQKYLFVRVLQPQSLSQIALALSLLIASNSFAQQASKDRKVITCSTTQIADFARQIVGDRCEVQCVLSPGQDPHTFQITKNSIDLVSQCDLCLDNGLHLEGGDWMRTLAKQEDKPIQSCTEGIKPLMIDQGGEEKAVADPHAWFSPKNALVYASNVNRAVSSIAPEHKSEFDARFELYRGQLRSLNSWAQRVFNKVPPSQRVLVTSHDAFNYFCDAFDFKSSAPVGWSTQEIGAEMTPASRKKVIDSIRDSGVPAIFVETSVNPEMIQGIAKEAGVMVGNPLYSDSMGVAGSAGETYIGMMRENIISIVNALTVSEKGNQPATASAGTTPNTE